MSEQTGPIGAPPASQATAIEQSRAVAEVQAAVVVAQQRPRSVQAALAELEQVCRQPALADRAFYRYPRSGEQVSGPTIALAREVARIWGNVSYGIAELSRDDRAGRSEMVAYAWDLQTNTRASNTFIVPHIRDTKDGRKPIVDLRDVYENNTNLGSRRVREMIFAVVPTWFIERAKALCSATLRDGGGVPLPQRIADSCKWYSDRWGVTLEQLERKLGRPSDRWTEHDLATLRVIGSSLQHGETTVRDEFEPDRVTAAEILAAPAPPPDPNPDPAPVDPPDAGDPDPDETAAAGEWPEVAQPPDGGGE